MFALSAAAVDREMVGKECDAELTGAVVDPDWEFPLADEA